MQSSLFFGLLDNRIRQLEKDVSKLLNEPELPKRATVTEEFSNYCSRIDYLGWSEFAAEYDISPRLTEQYKHVPETNLEPKSVIEVLVEQPFYPLARRLVGRHRELDHLPPPLPTSIRISRTHNKRLKALAPPANSQGVDLPTPYQIRCRSPAFLKILKDITGMNLTIGRFQHTIMFTKPFKFLVYAKDILKEVERLEQMEVGFQRRPLTVPPSEDDTQGLEELPNLKLFRELLLTELAPTIQVREDVMNGKLRRVLFADLWHVFKPGQEVRTSLIDHIRL